MSTINLEGMLKTPDLHGFIAQITSDDNSDAVANKRTQSTLPRM